MSLSICITCASLCEMKLQWMIHFVKWCHSEHIVQDGAECHRSNWNTKESKGFAKIHPCLFNHKTRHQFQSGGILVAIVLTSRHGKIFSRVLDGQQTIPSIKLHNYDDQKKKSKPPKKCFFCWHDTAINFVPNWNYTSSCVYDPRKTYAQETKLNLAKPDEAGPQISSNLCFYPI